MDEIVRKYKVGGLWHFTDRANIPLIQEHSGLLSLREIEARGINVPVPGGNTLSHNLDKAKGLDRYVHLTFIDNHPMLYSAQQQGRITEPIWLKIDTSVIKHPEVRFAPDVANKTGVELIDHKQAAAELDFEVLFTYTDWKDPTVFERRKLAEKYEVLVPDFVSKEKIIGWKNG